MFCSFLRNVACFLLLNDDIKAFVMKTEQLNIKQYHVLHAWLFILIEKLNIFSDFNCEFWPFKQKALLNSYILVRKRSIAKWIICPFSCSLT